MSDKEEVINKEVLKQDQDDKDEQDSTCSTSTEGTNNNNEARKELGLVITALQSTVKQNTEKEVKHEYDIHEADELHSDIEDIHSVTTTESNHMEEKTIAHIEEITEETTEQEDSKSVDNSGDVLEDITDQIAPPSKEEEKSPVDQDEIVPPTPGVAPTRQTFEFNSRQSEDALDTDTYSENLIALNKINVKDIKENVLNPRQQEKAGNKKKRKKLKFNELIL